VTTRDILSKLANEILTGIETEAQVVYLLAGIRKLIERDELKNQFPTLNFHCDWALHSSLDRAGAKAVLAIFDEAHPLLKDPGVGIADLPRELGREIDRISKMRSFKKELSMFLDLFKLPSLTSVRSDGWVHFLHLYAAVIADIPLKVPVPRENKPGPKLPKPVNISQVVVTVKMAPEVIRLAEFEEVVFAVVWTVDDVNGRSFSLPIYNSFSSKPGKESEAEQ
jgi:hypothetical protein